MHEIAEWRLTRLDEWLEQNVDTMDKAVTVGRYLLHIGEKVEETLGHLSLHVEKHKGGRGLKGGVRELARRLNVDHRTITRWMSGIQGKERTEKLLSENCHTSAPVSIEPELSKFELVERAPDPDAAACRIAEHFRETGEMPTKAEVQLIVDEQKIAIADPLAPIQLRLANVWNFGKSIPTQGSKGYEWGFNTGHITENLLYYYSQPGDLVVDPMAGSGTTVDACRRMKRRVLAFDKKPTRPDIQYNDLMAGVPVADATAHLVFLDPPYYTAMKNEFTSYGEWELLVLQAVSEANRILTLGGRITLIIMNLVYDKHETPRGLVGECYRFLRQQSGMEFENMILVPLLFNRPGFEVERMKASRQMINLARVVWVFRKNGNGSSFLSDIRGGVERLAM